MRQRSSVDQPPAIPVRIDPDLGSARAMLVAGTLLVARCRTPAATLRRKRAALAELGAVELTRE